MGSSDRYALFGHPVSHSRSPEIHHAFAEQTHESVHYELIDATPDAFEDHLREFFDGGGLGANVTLPHKLAAFEAADHVSSDAYRAGAVNTLALLEDGSLFGDNTDGAGLVRDLSVNHGVQIEGRRVLLIGAGGAARGAIGPLMDEGAAELVIANRHSGKAKLLAQLFTEMGNVQGSSLENLNGTFDVVVNATSASLRNEIPAVSSTVFSSTSFAYDMVYADKPTAFLEWATQQDVQGIADGWGMMVEQAAESFFIWRNVRPDTQSLLTRHSSRDAAR